MSVKKSSENELKLKEGVLSMFALGHTYAEVCSYYHISKSKASKIKKGVNSVPPIVLPIVPKTVLKTVPKIEFFISPEEIDFIVKLIIRATHRRTFSQEESKKALKILLRGSI